MATTGYQFSELSADAFWDPLAGEFVFGDLEFFPPMNPSVTDTQFAPAIVASFSGILLWTIITP